MDYSDLAQAIRENNTGRVDELLQKLIPRLHRFLSIHMNASKPDAQDCVQETILHCLEAIKNDNLRHPEKVISYLLTSCRNNYLKMLDKRKENAYDEVPEEHHHPAVQLANLLDDERKRLLEWCLKQLKEEYRLFMEFWFKHPEYEAEKVADHFNLSVSNTWTRKHRLINQLHECYKEKSEI